MKIIAETPHVRLVCDGKEHVGVDKQNGIRYIVQKCDCKDRKEPAAEVAPAPAVSEVPQVPAGRNSLPPATLRSALFCC